MKSIYTFAALAASLILSACSSENSKQIIEQEKTIETPPDVSYLVSGNVIDGYVSGATVWIDFNNNGTQDDDEPNAVSGNKGIYSLELTETERQCAQYSTLYVDVPVGAIDEDLGEVTEAYQMVRPPILDVITDDTLMHISPLTTVLWQGVKKELDGSAISDCETLLTDQTKRQEVAKLIEDSTYNTVSFHNISAEEIFEDFIASGNEKSKDYAQNIVKGLQKSFIYTKEVEEQYPDATEIRVVHYFGTNGYYSDDEESHWFRETIIFGETNFHSRDDLMSDSLDEILQPIYYRDAVDFAWGEGTLTSTKDVIYRGEQSGYECAFNESVSITEDEVTYKLTNSNPVKSHVEAISDCQDSDFENIIPERIFYINYQIGEKWYLAELAQIDGVVTVLPHWVDFEGRSAEFDVAEIVAQLKDSGYQFENEVLIPTSWWRKRKAWDEGDTRYQIDYNNAGEWTKTVILEDGTHTVECSYDKGQTWEACQE